MTEPTSVYLYYDRLGVLLYVGITKRGITRQDEHAVKEWWPFVAKQEIEHHDSREVAAARETMLIKERRPPFNKQQNRDHHKLRAAYLTLFSERTSQLPADERCGHCGPCLDVDGPCMVNPSSAAHEPSLACDCGDPLCAYQAGREAGSQEGWSIATNLHKAKPCGHCGGCRWNAEHPDNQDGICRLLAVLADDEERSSCPICGRVDCMYRDGLDAGLERGWEDGFEAAQGRLGRARAQGDSEFERLLNWSPRS